MPGASIGLATEHHQMDVLLSAIAAKDEKTQCAGLVVHP